MAIGSRIVSQARNLQEGRERLAIVDTFLWHGEIQ